VECKNVLIEGISLKNPPMWTVHPIYCENVTVDGISIHNPADSPNTDGINPDACKYMHISNCHISVGDDCITIKSGRDEDGRRVGRACENITITNCTMLDGHGGIVIGSEMSGDVRKVTISNCVFDGTDRGIRIKSMRGRGGVVEEIRVSNIVMKNIKEEAVKLNMFYHTTPDEPVSERTPSFRNIHLSNITVSQSQKAGFLLGLAELPIENITFNNININAKTGFTIKDAKNIEFHNVQVNVEQGPGLHAEKTENLEISGFKTLHPLADIPFIDVNNVQNLQLYNCFPLAGMNPFIKISGKSSKNVMIQNNNFINLNDPVSIGQNVPEGAVVQD
jgi:polygalacturonase